MNKEMLLSVMAIVGLFVSGCVPESQPVSTETGMPTETSTETVFTATVNPTFTPRPTQTATPIPDWITNFAEPILKAIADSPPTYQDDFSNPQSGWYVGRKEKNLDPQSQATPPISGQHLFGESGYVDGTYFTTADPFSCLGGRNSEMDSYRDFVAEFDVRFVSGVNGSWELQFHRNVIGKYSIGKSMVGGIGFGKCDPECGGLADFGEDPTKGPDEWNHFLLIVRNPRMAAYVNGVPILYHEDKAYTDALGTGIFVFTTCSEVDTPMEIRWDNFTVWDISNLP